METSLEEGKLSIQICCTCLKNNLLSYAVGAEVLVYIYIYILRCCCYSFPWNASLTLNQYLIMLSVKQGIIKYHFRVFRMTWPRIEHRSPGPLVSTIPNIPKGHHIYIYIYVVIHRQTGLLYHKVSLRLDSWDVSSWDQNPADFCSVGWYCRIHRLNLSRGVRNPTQWMYWIWH